MAVDSWRALDPRNLNSNYNNNSNSNPDESEDEIFYAEPGECETSPPIQTRSQNSVFNAKIEHANTPDLHTAALPFTRHSILGIGMQQSIFSKFAHCILLLPYKPVSLELNVNTASLIVVTDHDPMYRPAYTEWYIDTALLYLCCG